MIKLFKGFLAFLKRRAALTVLVLGFIGAIHGKRERKGVFITNSKFTNDAYEYVKKTDVKVILIDGKKLANLVDELRIEIN